jgi:hypothetical protein
MSCQQLLWSDRPTCSIPICLVIPTYLVIPIYLVVPIYLAIPIYLVIPAKAGIQMTLPRIAPSGPTLLDSGSSLRCARNDDGINHDTRSTAHRLRAYNFGCITDKGSA